MTSLTEFVIAAPDHLNRRGPKGDVAALHRRNEIACGAANAEKFMTDRSEVPH